MRICKIALLLMAVARLSQPAAADGESQDSLYRAWLSMYDLDFARAHQEIGRWRLQNLKSALGPVSDAAGFLFREFARLGVLESALFVDNNAFLNREQSSPDRHAREQFFSQAAEAERLADQTLAKNPNDPEALFAKSMIYGLRADYASLIEKQDLSALNMTRLSRDFSERVTAVDPKNYDAYLAPGLENYLVSLRSAPVRLFLRLTGAHTDKEKGLEQLKKTAEHGKYLEPFAKVLLAVAALRDGNKNQAKKLLGELHNRFPNNSLYARELGRLQGAQP